MKKTVLLLPLFILCFFSSCEDDKPQSNSEVTPIETVDTLLVIGDRTATIIPLDTVITPSDRCHDILYEIDMNRDGANDVGLYIYYCFSPMYYGSKIEFRCLNGDAYFLADDSLSTPRIMALGDTLKPARNWKQENVTMVSAHTEEEMYMNGGTIYKEGRWFDISNKYIGVLVEKDGNPVYGWIKLSVPDDNEIHTTIVHEMGYKVADYPLDR